MIKLECGKTYPLPLDQSANAGAAAQFLLKSGNILQIALPHMTGKEQNTLKYGMIKAGFLYDSGALLLLFQFYGQDGRPLITFDAPFDIRLLPSDRRNLHTIDNTKQRLVIEIHVVDEKKILRVIRLVTMPPDLTLAFLAAVQNQLTALDKPGVMEKWLQNDPGILLTLTTKNWLLGH